MRGFIHRLGDYSKNISIQTNGVHTMQKTPFITLASLFLFTCFFAVCSLTLADYMLMNWQDFTASARVVAGLIEFLLLALLAIHLIVFFQIIGE